MIQGILPLPEGQTFQSWALQFGSFFPEVIIPYPPPSKQWRGWASYLLMYEEFLELPVPDEKLFKGENGWLPWALQSISILQT